MTTKEKQEEVRKAAADLKKFIPKGSTVYGITRYVSRSGASRVISIVAFYKGASLHPNYSVGLLTGRKVKRGFQDGLVSNGCGFDHLESIVRDLERALGYPAGSLKYELL